MVMITVRSLVVMTMMMVVVAMTSFPTCAFMGLQQQQQQLSKKVIGAGGVTKTSLFIGPLQKITNKGEYEKVVKGLMKTKGYTREQAEKEYNSYLDNPTNYALQKGEEYYKSLGYKTLIEGVIGEAEKEGRGEEVRARIEKFQKESKLKGLATITFFIILGAYYNSIAPPVILNNH